MNIRKYIGTMLMTLCLTVTMVLTVAVPVSAASDNERPENVPEQITIYGMRKEYEEYLSIPEEYPQSWSFDAHTVEFKSGCKLDIDENGVVKVWGKQMYYHQIDGGLWVGTEVPTGMPGEVSTFEYEYGTAEILVGGKWTVTVHAMSYATYYAEQTMDN